MGKGRRKGTGEGRKGRKGRGFFYYLLILLILHTALQVHVDYFGALFLEACTVFRRVKISVLDGVC